MGGVGGTSGGLGRGQRGTAVLHSLSDMLLLLRLLTGHNCGSPPMVGGDDSWGGEGVQNLENVIK